MQPGADLGGPGRIAPVLRGRVGLGEDPRHVAEIERLSAVQQRFVVSKANTLTRWPAAGGAGISK